MKTYDLFVSVFDELCKCYHCDIDNKDQTMEGGGSINYQHYFQMLLCCIFYIAVGLDLCLILKK